VMPSMEKSSAKSLAPTNPDGLESQVGTVGSFLWAIFDFQMQRLHSPLPWLMRFTIALSGSFSLFLGFLVIGLFNSDRQDPGMNVPIFEDAGFGGGMIWFVGGVLSAFFATLVSVGPTKSGPVRLYLAGLFLPAISVNVVQWTWGFGI